MNQHIERAQLLIQQDRFEQAEDSLRQALADDPQNGYAHSLLAICMMRDRDQLLAATQEAEQGIHCEPEFSFSYYAHSMVMQKRGQYDAAMQSVKRAIEIDPTDAAFHASQAGLFAHSDKWAECLEATETGLSFDPENQQCASLRSHALERLGRVTDALEEAERAARQDPDSPHAHSSRGWALLNKGDHRGAQQAFREALRLDPSDEFSRRGMISSLNSNNFLFRNFYRFMLMMSRLDQRTQWGLIIGLWIGIRVLGSLAQKHEWLGPWVLPISICYLLFVMMSWIANPLFNTFLRFHPFGKHLLSTKEKWASNSIAIAFGVGALGAAACLAQMDWIGAVLVFVFAIYLTIPLSVPFNTSAKWATQVAALIAGAFSLIYLGIVAGIVADFIKVQWIQIYQFGILIYCFAAQKLLSAEDRV
ncbi:tetratricopeptide repeat protein [Planctomycetes bacterium K23_9]|uniref:Tetratricopeptide repeat protein n=1 Tax=Stieleria marina TaxID=1930275 RepID=A0A517NTA1_9BACT|nr:Tetratricopeptide repeat protein [Planctomycetes bacterium K23_9]